MKFLADVMVCNLARWLRIFGYDAACAGAAATDRELIETANREGRIFLTRDKKCASGRGVLVLQSTSVLEQLREIQKAFCLQIDFPKETRCAACNGELGKVEKEKIKEKVPAKNKSTQFWLCKSCGKAYWRGAHWKKIEEMVEALKH